MSDNVRLPIPTTDGDLIASDDIGGVKFQRIKLVLGDDGVNGGDVSASNPVPVEGSVIVGNFPASQTVSGSVSVDNFPATQAVSATTLPLPTGASTETTLSAINTKLPTASVDHPLAATPSLPVRVSPQELWDWSFVKAITNNVDTTKGTLIRTGTGQTVNQTGGNLVITAGTTANSETVIRSLSSWNGALTMWEATTLSQRIVNNNFFLELVDVIGDGLTYNIVSAVLVDVTKTAHGYTAENVGQRMDLCAITGAAGIPMEGVIASIPDANTIRFTVAGWPASGSGTLSLTGWNKIELNYTSTTATNVTFNTRRQGYQNTAVAATINTSASGHQAAVNVSSGVASLADQVLTSAGVLANRNAWKLNVPEQDVTLYYQVRCRNGTTNPATSTTWTLGMLRVEDYIAQQVEITSTRQQSIGNSLPVAVISAPSTAVTGSVTATLAASAVRAGFVAGAGIWYDDSSATLAGAATFTGTSRDLTVTATATAFANAATYANELRVSAESDVTGTLWLEVSRDNTNWRRVKSLATSAVTGGGFYAEIVHRPSWRYARVGYTNGAGAQARFTIGSITTAL